MTFAKLVFAMSILLISAGVSFAQGNKRLDTSESVRINKTKPTIYTEFVKTGECSYTETLSVLAYKPCESKRTDIIEKFDAVWVRLINNSKWAVQVDVKNIFTAPVVRPVRLADKRIRREHQMARRLM